MHGAILEDTGHETLVTENVLLHPGFPCTLLGPHRVTPGCEGTP